ncbi:MAG: twin-arginine translocation signal domain-containing protein [SAR324 cluster bacterium]|nr:twin-arginine translocation signal domain-containing protein [SAR324 cluster bacterium]
MQNEQSALIHEILRRIGIKDKQQEAAQLCGCGSHGQDRETTGLPRRNFLKAGLAAGVAAAALGIAGGEARAASDAYKDPEKGILPPSNMKLDHARAALVITEPSAGSDATGMTTRFTPDGDEIVIDGGKIRADGPPKELLAACEGRRLVVCAEASVEDLKECLGAVVGSVQVEVAVGLVRAKPAHAALEPEQPVADGELGIALDGPAGVRRIDVLSACEMLDAASEILATTACEVLFAVAAVADFRPSDRKDGS